MTARIMPTSNQMAEALTVSASLTRAAKMLDVDPGFLRWRAQKDPILLLPLFRACAARGNELKSSYVRKRRSA